MEDGIDDVGVERVAVVERHAVVDIGRAACDESEVPPVVRTMALTVSKSLVSSESSATELVPVVGEDKREVVDVQRLVPLAKSMRLSSGG